MWAIIDSRAPKEAIAKLKETFDVLEFKSEGVTYKEVSGHPDIFIFQDIDKFIIAPNSPNELIHFFRKHRVNFTFGKKEVGTDLNNSTQYNCIVTDNLLLHKKGFTDDVILSINQDKKLVELPQAYTRCSLTKLNNNNFITSDSGIYKKLKEEKLNTLLIDPKPIKLPGYPYGFFGGTNGIHNNTFYLIGSLKHHPQCEEIKTFINDNELEMIELHQGNLYDGGGVFFGDSHS